MIDHSTSIAADEFVIRGLMNVAEAIALQDLDGVEAAGSVDYGREFKNEVFEMHPENWSGSCTCDLEKRDDAWWQAHPHKSGCPEKRLNRYADRLEKKYHRGEITFEESGTLLKRSAIKQGWAKEQDFLPQAPCLCGANKAYMRWIRKNDHAPDCRLVVPNFRCGDFEVTWYKRIGRSTAISREITCAEAYELFRRCITSLSGKESSKI
ncbi:MAG: hypothetical protein AAB421_00005 [Patescibacteria group bacterium]